MYIYICRRSTWRSTRMPREALQLSSSTTGTQMNVCLYVCLPWLPSLAAFYVCLVSPSATTGMLESDAAARPDGRETPLLHSLRCRVRHLCCTHCAVVCAIGLGQGSLGKVALRQTTLLPEATCALVRRLLIVMVDPPPSPPFPPLSLTRAFSLAFSTRARSLACFLSVSCFLPLSPSLSPSLSLSLSP